LDHHTSCELIQSIRSWDAFDLHPILALVGVSWFEEARVPFWFIAQEQQTFRVRIEAADGVNILWKPKPGQRTIRRTIRRELREHAVRFVKGNQHARRVKRDSGQSNGLEDLQLICISGDIFMASRIPTPASLR
jgi:hypothetical protein